MQSLKYGLIKLFGGVETRNFSRRIWLLTDGGYLWIHLFGKAPSNKFFQSLPVIHLEASSLFLRASLSCATIIEGCSIMIDGYPAFCVNIEKGLLKQSFFTGIPTDHLLLTFWNKYNEPYNGTGKYDCPGFSNGDIGNRNGL